jgi:hypothetical protein
MICKFPTRPHLDDHHAHFELLSLPINEFQYAFWECEKLKRNLALLHAPQFQGFSHVQGWSMFGDETASSNSTLDLMFCLQNSVAGIARVAVSDDLDEARGKYAVVNECCSQATWFSRSR